MTLEQGIGAALCLVGILLIVWRKPIGAWYEYTLRDSRNYGELSERESEIYFVISGISSFIAGLAFLLEVITM